MDVLLVAPTIDGNDVGEAWVAHQWASRLGARHHLTVLTYCKRGAEPASRQLPGVEVVEWDEPRIFHRFERFNSLAKPGYPLFAAKAARWIRTALAAGRRFDIAHQPVPVGMRYPSPLRDLPIPFVLGPVGGSLQSPPAFVAEEGTAPWYSALRGIDGLRLQHDFALRRSYEQAACVLGIAPYVAAHLRRPNLQRVEVLAETGLDQVPAPVDRTNRQGPVRLLFVGRLVRTKGARDAIRAMAHLADHDVHLDLVGDGPDRAACEELTRDLHQGHRVTFHGRLARNDIDAFYRAADLFVFPSYREPGGNVPFEAMGYGLPLIVADRGGPEAATDEQCAVRVVPVDPRSYARRVAKAIGQLVDDPARRTAMGAAARARAMEVGLWEAKIDRICDLYTELADQGPSGGAA